MAKLLRFPCQLWEQAAGKFPSAWELGGSLHPGCYRAILPLSLSVLAPVCHRAFPSILLTNVSINRISLKSPFLTVMHFLRLWTPQSPQDPASKIPSQHVIPYFHIALVFKYFPFFFFFLFGPRSAADLRAAHRFARASHFHFAWQVFASLCSPAASDSSSYPERFTRSYWNHQLLCSAMNIRRERTWLGSCSVIAD